jgi:ferredoxin
MDDAEPRSVRRVIGYANNVFDRSGGGMRRMLVAIFPLILGAIACLSTGDGLGPGPLLSTTLLVDTGRTPAPPGMAWDTGFERVFVLRWTPADGIDHYVVKVLDEPIDAGNWDAAIPVDTVGGAQDTAWVSLRPLVYSNSCIGCGLCVTACPQEAISLVDGRAVIDPSKCLSCGQCVLRCPVKSIRDARMGQFYYFAIRAYTADNSPSEQIACTSDAYRIIYRNDVPPYPLSCARCNGAGTSRCYAVIYDPPCPVDAIYWDPDPSFLIHIDQEKCIYCGWCFKHCNGLAGDPEEGVHTIGTVVEALTP